MEQQRAKLGKLEETIGQEDQKVAEQKQVRASVGLPSSHTPLSLLLCEDQLYLAVLAFLLFPSQEEESLLVLVEECQSVMLELQNSLLEKKTEVADSKAQVDQNMKVLQESSR